MYVVPNSYNPVWKLWKIWPGLISRSGFFLIILLHTFLIILRETIFNWLIYSISCRTLNEGLILKQNTFKLEKTHTPYREEHQISKNGTQILSVYHAVCMNIIQLLWYSWTEETKSWIQRKQSVWRELVVWTVSSKTSKKVQMA
jgi:hypothetical protein